MPEKWVLDAAQQAVPERGKAGALCLPQVPAVTQLPGCGAGRGNPNQTSWSCPVGDQSQEFVGQVSCSLQGRAPGGAAERDPEMCRGACLSSLGESWSAQGPAQGQGKNRQNGAGTSVRW